MMYVQCVIEKDSQIDHTWIETPKAIKNATARVKRMGDEWEDGWKITQVYDGIKLTEEQVKANRDAHKGHRSRTDI